MADAVGVRVQRFDITEQALMLAQLAAAHRGSPNFAPRDLEAMFAAVGLPPPSKASNAIASLCRRGWATSGIGKGYWQLTPLGKAKVSTLLSDMDIAALAAEAASEHGPLLGGAVHTVIPPTLAPPSLLGALRSFLQEHPFDTNVFGTTRFPADELREEDPVALALTAARETCRKYGLQLHLASDRAIDDDLWTNVAGHMWGCRYGLAIFENRIGRGLNYNLTIEVGSMLMTGRRCALLKDTSIERTPTDLVGRIYKDVDLDEPRSVTAAVSSWIEDDLAIG